MYYIYNKGCGFLFFLLTGLVHKADSVMGVNAIINTSEY